VFLKLFQALRLSGIPVTIREYLDMLAGLEQGICNNNSIEEFYHFSKMSLIKDEKYFDRFDKVFENFYELNKEFYREINSKIPKDWIENQLNKIFTDEMKKKISNDKDWEEVLKQFQKILEEQKKKHQGGNKWLGTGGTSMYGNSGYNPKGIRVGGTSKNKSAIKIWEKREFENLDDKVSLNTRNIQVVLKRLRNLLGKVQNLNLI